MTTIAECGQILQTLFTNFADDAARETGFIQRRRQFSGASFVRTVVFGWLEQPNATLADLCELSATFGASVSCQALDQRFGPAAAQFLGAVLQQALYRAVTAEPAALPLLQRFQGVYVLDSTTLSLPATLAELLPGCGGGQGPGDGQAACKVQVCVELSAGALEDLTVLTGRTQELQSPLGHRPLPPGAVRLADLGFFDLSLLRRYTEEGVFWINRLHPTTRVWCAGHKTSLLDFLRVHAAERTEMWVELGQERLPARLLAVRVSEETANRRRQKMQHKARRKSQPLSAERLALADWDVLITNVPAERLTLPEAWALRRVRWQVELLFKVWKSEGRLDELRGHKPYRVLCELWAKLLALVVQHWTLLVCGGVSLLYSHRQGARRVRRIALWLAWQLDDLGALQGLLEKLQQRLQCCRIRSRRKRPATFQLLTDPQTDGATRLCSCALT